LAYSRAKFFWGAVDLIHSDETPYTPAQIHPMGENGLPPGIGVRRAQLVFTRETLAPPQDAMTTHCDFLNLTNGSPDDTWTDADFTAIESQMSQWIAELEPFMHTSVLWHEVRWYRVGPAITPPNPAIRVVQASQNGNATTALPPQVAASVTLKTVPRRQWGRMYLPLTGQTVLSATGRFLPANVTTVGQSTDAFFQSVIALDFHPVIFSEVRGKAYAVEEVQVDDVPDIIRSRRFNEATFKFRAPQP